MALIFDLGEVLFTWSPDTKTLISVKLMRNILSSPIWFEYECGRISQDVCYNQIAQHFCVPTPEVAEAFSQARDSLRANDVMISFIHRLKDKYQGALRVYAMSNVAKEDYAVLSSKLADWSVFDRVFTSGHCGMRKPDVSFYQHVLEETHLRPQEAIFIDDKLENVLSARSLGIRSIIFDLAANVIEALRHVYSSPVEKGNEFLQRNAKQMHSVTETGLVVQDNFAQLLILETTHDQQVPPIFFQTDFFTKQKSRNLVLIEKRPRTWNFFAGKPVLPSCSSSYFPDDLDTTSLALTVFQPIDEVINSVLDEMEEYINEDGTIQTYYDRTRLRTDPVVTANILACFYRYGRGQQLSPTLQWINDIISHRVYLKGTRYYPSPDCCLFFFCRLLHSSGEPDLEASLGSLLKDHMKERVGQRGSALDLAMRVVACDSLGLECSVDRAALLELQREDGGWDAGWIYSYGSTGLKLGNEGVTTALAVRAIAAWRGGVPVHMDQAAV